MSLACLFKGVSKQNKSNESKHVNQINAKIIHYFLFG